jgi:hypothetical protein
MYRLAIMPLESKGTLDQTKLSKTRVKIEFDAFDDDDDGDNDDDDDDADADAPDSSTDDDTAGNSQGSARPRNQAPSLTSRLSAAAQ